MIERGCRELPALSKPEPICHVNILGLNPYYVLCNLLKNRGSCDGKSDLGSTRRALVFHVGNSRVSLVSLQLHLSFPCSTLNPSSFTSGSFCKQRVQWMLHNWHIRAWRPASRKHSPATYVFGKGYTFFVTSTSLEKPPSPFLSFNENTYCPLLMIAVHQLNFMWIINILYANGQQLSIRYLF